MKLFILSEKYKNLTVDLSHFIVLYSKMAQLIGLVLSKVATLAGVEAKPKPRELVEDEDITAIPKVQCIY